LKKYPFVNNEKFVKKSKLSRVFGKMLKSKTQNKKEKHRERMTEEGERKNKQRKYFNN